VAIFAVAFAVFVGFRFKRRIAPAGPVSIMRTDPKAIVESTGGKVMRFSRGREDVRVEYDRQLTYADGSTRLVGVPVVTEDSAGAGGSEVISGTATFMRRDRAVRFDRRMTARRVAQTIEAESAIAHLTPDQQRIETLELHGQPKITGVNPAVGGLQALTGRD